eukprot:jgi/Chrzof1/796/Cz01g29050.t1
MMQSTQSLMQLEELMMASIKLINYKHLGAIACKVPQLASAAQSQYTTPKQVQRIMLQLEKLYLQAMNVLPVRPISYLVYAASKVGYQLRQQAIMAAAQHLLAHEGSRITQASAADLAMLTWGLGKQGVQLQALYNAVAQAFVSQGESLTARHVATMVTGLTLTDYRDSHVLSELAKQAQGVLNPSTPRQLAHMAISFATMGYPDESLLAGIADAVKPKLQELDQKLLGLMLYSYSISQHISTPTLLEAAAPLIPKLVPAMPPVALASLARTYHRVGSFDTSSVLAALSEAAADKLEQFTTRELHWLASAFVHGNASPRLVEQLANVVVAKIADGEPFQWSQLTSFAKVLRAATHPAAADVQAAIDALNNKHTGADGSHQDSEAAGGQQQHQQQQQPSAVHHLWSMHGNSFVAVA